jgi:hypothetical protein
MNLENKIPSKKNIFDTLKKHLDITEKFLQFVNVNQENYELKSPVDNWDVHIIIKDKPKVANYFSKKMSGKSISLLNEYKSIYKIAGKRAFLADYEIQEINFPWFENMDLNQNLQKKLKNDELRKYNSKTTYIQNANFTQINKSALNDVIFQFKNSNLYYRKKKHEERMISYLEEKI